MSDLLRYIADARAQMLMRGYEPLRLEIGRSTFRQLVNEGWPTQTDNVLGMAVTERDDIEGFAVLHAPG